jgi:hypothetical protein
VSPSSGYPGDGAIHTASVWSLQQTLPDDVAAEIRRSFARADLFPVYVTGAAVLLLVALASLHGWACCSSCSPVAASERIAGMPNAGRARLLYDADDPAAMGRFALASAVALGSTHASRSSLE